VRGCGASHQGKTTTINLLTGLFPPTSGAAAVYGHSVSDDLGGARKVLGVCPQHDVLFESLTTRVHIIFFALLKVRRVRGGHREHRACCRRVLAFVHSLVYFFGLLLVLMLLPKRCG